MSWAPFSECWPWKKSWFPWATKDTLLHKGETPEPEPLSKRSYGMIRSFPEYLIYNEGCISAPPCKRVALVIARGETPEYYKRELRKFDYLHGHDRSIVILVNYVAPHSIEHFIPDIVATAHHDHVDTFKALYLQHHSGYIAAHMDKVDFVTPKTTDEMVSANGSSSLFAVRLALKQGVDSVTVLGSPLTGDYEKYRPAWIEAKKRWFHGKVNLVLSNPEDQWLDKEEQ